MIDNHQIAKSLNLLCKAERPVIMCGGGVITGEASEELLKLAKRLKEFTLCDMVLLTEIEEKIVKHYLDEFIFYGIIRTKVGNRYVFLKEPDTPIEIPSVGIKLADALNIYIQKCLKSRKPSTSRGHRIYTDKHILPFFKDKSISDISPMDIVEFIKHIQSQGYTHRTVPS